MAVCCGLLFAVLTWQIAVHGPLRALDEQLGRAVAAGGIPSSAAEFLADLGNTVVALPVLVAAMAWAGGRGWREWREWRRRLQNQERPDDGTDRGPDDGTDDGTDRGPEGGPGARWWLPPLAAGLALAAVPALVVPLKLWLARPGPPQMAGGVHDGFYPSGHGATAAVGYGVVALLLVRGRRRAGRRVVWLGVGGVVLGNVGVGLGLVRRGYHWPLDVLGSWCLAGVLLVVWCAVCDRWGPGRGRRGPH
ncbi:phosphatase PAP2 family protein [Streptomyces sp. NPDC048506]|uniref:phosphatase PAP2 family protein n=1 Tax=Streptomyces sp. NPDC048506 TaxID=3155028 RepID=UPI00344A43EF